MQEGWSHDMTSNVHQAYAHFLAIVQHFLPGCGAKIPGRPTGNVDGLWRMKEQPTQINMNEA